jgi:hypothetical protein
LRDWLTTACSCDINLLSQILVDDTLSNERQYFEMRRRSEETTNDIKKNSIV